VGFTNDVTVAVWIGYDNADGKRSPSPFSKSAAGRVDLVGDLDGIDDYAVRTHERHTGVLAQDLLLQNLPPAHNFTDAATVMRFRELVRSQAIRSALERSSDTLLTFALRAVERVVSDQSRTNRETINQLWDILDDPHLNKALGLPQNSRMTFRRSRF
jgi:membrane peptidoglycan carboxypeptidase